jgi:hypothetical protein
LRYLQTLTQVAGDKTSTLVFPVPIDLLTNFMIHGATPSVPPAPPAAPGTPKPDLPPRIDPVA